MKPREKVTGKGMLAKLNAKPLYRAIINSAKEDGLTNAVAFHTHYGFFQRRSHPGRWRGNPQRQPDAVRGNSSTTRTRWKTFCRKHGDLLKGKVIAYKHIEQWTIQANHGLTKNRGGLPTSSERSGPVGGSELT